MPNNTNHHSARKNRNDEFYTPMNVVENELQHYKQYFEDKTVYCNCDRVFQSNFMSYFYDKIYELKLKRLFVTGYCQSNPLFDDGNKPLFGEFGGDSNEVNYFVKYLQGDGDFRSAECVELLKQSDIVVTNPPFSLFSEYVKQLIEYDKKFIILGDQNAFTYKDIFPLLRDNKMWLGASGSGHEFLIPNEYELKNNAGRVDENGNKYLKVKSSCWFTNLDHGKRNKKLVLNTRYDPSKYLTYHNYDAINVDRVKDIPYDWHGVMGVPISYLHKHNPDQFKIVGLGAGKLGREIGIKMYDKKHAEYLKRVENKVMGSGIPYIVQDGHVIMPYARLLIQRV